MQREVVVLGGNGFLGTNLCEALWKNGIKPIVLDKSLGCDLATGDGQQIFKDVLENLNDIDNIDVVMMAANVGSQLFENDPLSPYYENKAINDKCIDTMMNFANPTSKFHVTFYSTSEVYGNIDPLSVPCKLMPTIDPSYSRSLYSQEKLVVETLLNHLENFGKISSLRIFRPFNVSGKWQKRGVLFKMVESAIKQGEVEYAANQTREITFVQDATDQALSMIMSRKSGTYDLTSKNHILLKDLAYSIKFILNEMNPFLKINLVEMNPGCCYIKTRGTTKLMNSSDDLVSFIKLLKQHNTISDIADAI